MENCVDFDELTILDKEYDHLIELVCTEVFPLPKCYQYMHGNFVP